MNAVGIDVSKGKSMVAIMRPFGEVVTTPFEKEYITTAPYLISIPNTGRFLVVLCYILSFRVLS